MSADPAVQAGADAGLPLRSKHDILEEMRRVLAQNFEVDAAKVTPEARFAEDLDIDSIDVVDLVLELRHYSGAQLEPRMFRGVKTVAQAVDVVHGALAAAR